MRKTLLGGFGLVAAVVAVLGGGNAEEGSVASAAALRESLAANRAANLLYVRAVHTAPAERLVVLSEAIARKKTILSALRAIDGGALEEARYAAISSVEADLHLLDGEAALAHAAEAGATRTQIERMQVELERLKRSSAVRHARLDDLAVRNGLLPYRTISPF